MLYFEKQVHSIVLSNFMKKNDSVGKLYSMYVINGCAQ